MLQQQLELQAKFQKYSWKCFLGQLLAYCLTQRNLVALNHYCYRMQFLQFDQQHLQKLHPVYMKANQFVSNHEHYLLQKILGLTLNLTAVLLKLFLEMLGNIVFQIYQEVRCYLVKERQL